MASAGRVIDGRGHVQARQPSSKTKAQQSRMRTLSNARKTLASMQTLADAMSSVQGQHLRPPEAGAGDGVAPAEGGGDAAASGPMVVASGAVIANGNVMNGPELEVEVFKDLVRLPHACTCDREASRAAMGEVVTGRPIHGHDCSQRAAACPTLWTAAISQSCDVFAGAECKGMRVRVCAAVYGHPGC